MTKIKIFTMTHKKFETPLDTMYAPLFVGSAGKETFGYLRDDAGSNISRKNCYYSELTGFYWVWKNVRDCDFVGTCHYRRYLLNPQGKIFTGAEYLDALARHDMITTKRVELNNSYRYGFSANHNVRVLDMTGEVIRERFPEYYGAFMELVNGNETYFGNMLVAAKPLFDAYCAWLFQIFSEVEGRVDLEDGADDYHKRVFGFISEFLLLVWARVRRLRVLECKVGMLGEKAETREMKERLAAYFLARDCDGAKRYFMECLKRRPDVLMEASDITGELRLSMQIIATAGLERERYGRCALDSENRFPQLVELFTRLNEAAGRIAANRATEEDRAFLKDSGLSETAVETAVGLFR